MYIISGCVQWWSVVANAMTICPRRLELSCCVFNYVQTIVSDCSISCTSTFNVTQITFVKCATLANNDVMLYDCVCWCMGGRCFWCSSKWCSMVSKVLVHDVQRLHNALARLSDELDVRYPSWQLYVIEYLCRFEYVQAVWTDVLVVVALSAILNAWQCVAGVRQAHEFV